MSRFSFLVLSPCSRGIFVILEAFRSPEMWNVHRDEPHSIFVMSVTFLESARVRLRGASNDVKANTFEQGLILTTLTHEMRFVEFSCTPMDGTPGTFWNGHVLGRFWDPSHTFGSWDDSVPPLTRNSRILVLGPWNLCSVLLCVNMDFEICVRYHFLSSCDLGTKNTNVDDTFIKCLFNIICGFFLIKLKIWLKVKYLLVLYNAL